MPHHTLFENTAITALPNAAGTIVNTTVDGTTVGTVMANTYEYSALVYAGTIANTGTLFVYALGGGGTGVAAAGGGGIGAAAAGASARSSASTLARTLASTFFLFFHEPS